MRSSRDSVKIVYDILEYCRHSPKRITWISGRCNLSFMTAMKYVDSCLRSGLLEKCEDGFLSNKKGVVYVTQYCELLSLLSDE